MSNLPVETATFQSEIEGKRQMVIDLISGQSKPAMLTQPRLSSARSDWNGFILEEHGGNEVDTKDVMVPHHTVVVQISQAAPIKIRIDSQPSRTIHKSAGLVDFIPAGTTLNAQTFNCGDYLALMLDPTFFYYSVHEMVNSDQIDFLPCLQREDAFLKELLMILRMEIQQGNPGGRIYAEFMGSAIAMHLARHYSTQKVNLPYRQGGLSPALLRRVLDYIQSNLASNITLECLSGLAGLSAFHFSRQFKKSTGLAPHQFLLSRRIQKAKDLLGLGRISIAQVALKTGFCDQSHFATHFKRQTSLTPKQFLTKIRSKRIVS